MGGLGEFTMSGWVKPGLITDNRVGLFGQNDARTESGVNLRPLTPQEQAIQRQAMSQIQGLTGQLGGNLGGDAGNVIGDIIGLPKKTETKPENTATPEDGTAETPAEPVATEAEPAKPQTIEDAAKDAAENAARDALGGLFGSKKKKTTEDDTPPESSDQGN